MMAAKKEKVAVLGYHDGNAGQIAEWFERVTGLKIALFVEDGDGPMHIDPAAENAKRVSQRMEYPTPDSFKGRPFLVCRDWPERLRRMGIKKILPITSNNAKRLENITRCREHGFELVSAIHPTVTVLDQALIEPGVWINAGAIIGYKAEIKAGAMINTGTQIDHHGILETCCQLDPAVVTAGNVTIRRTAQVHTGAVIINRMTIGEGSIVGAGAVVIEDVPPHCTVVGVPARIVRRDQGRSVDQHDRDSLNIFKEHANDKGHH
jgi:sugar O-acyltransferase (sialic acid O-acetyltransferase NeuD family)